MIMIPEGGNQSGRARARAIRARMTATGESYTRAARHHDAEHRGGSITIPSAEPRCPQCASGALILGDGQPRCDRCGARWDSGSSAADEYAGTILHLNWYEAGHGRSDAPAEDCSTCYETAVVWDTFDRSDSERLGVCFSCGQTFNSHCPRCNRPDLILDDADAGPCSECVDEFMQRSST